MKTDDQKFVAYAVTSEGENFKEYRFSVTMLKKLLIRIEENEGLIARIRSHADMKKREREAGRRYMEDAPYLMEVLNLIEDRIGDNKYALSAQILSAVECVLSGTRIKDLYIIPTARELQNRK